MPAAILIFPNSATPLPTIADLHDAFLDAAERRRGASTNTLRSELSDLTMLARDLPQPIDAITRRDLERVLMTCDERSATSNRRIASCKQFFRWCRREGYLTHDPAEDLEPKTQPVSLALPHPRRRSAGARPGDQSPRPRRR